MQSAGKDIAKRINQYQLRKNINRIVKIYLCDPERAYLLFIFNNLYEYLQLKIILTNCLQNGN